MDHKTLKGSMDQAREWGRPGSGSIGWPILPAQVPSHVVPKFMAEK